MLSKRGNHHIKFRARSSELASLVPKNGEEISIGKSGVWEEIRISGQNIDGWVGVSREASTLTLGLHRVADADRANRGSKSTRADILTDQCST